MEALVKLDSIEVGQGLEIVENLWVIKISDNQQYYALANDAEVLLIDPPSTYLSDFLQELLRDRGWPLRGIIFTSRPSYSSFRRQTYMVRDAVINAPIYLHSFDIQQNENIQALDIAYQLRGEFQLSYTHFGSISHGSFILSRDVDGGVVFVGAHAHGTHSEPSKKGLLLPRLSEEANYNNIVKWENLDINMKHILPQYGYPIVYMANHEELAHLLINLLASEPYDITMDAGEDDTMTDQLLG